jgi:uncharacterized protein
MIDWQRVEGFEWDDGNNRKSVDKHAVSQTEAEQVFLSEPLLIVRDPAHSAREDRFHALGQSDFGRLLHITFTSRQGNRLIRVISARPMHRRERVRYEQER